MSFRNLPKVESWPKTSIMSYFKVLMHLVQNGWNTGKVSNTGERKLLLVWRVRDIINQKSGDQQRLTIDSEVREFQTVDLYHRH